MSFAITPVLGAPEPRGVDRIGEMRMGQAVAIHVGIERKMKLLIL